MSQEHNQDGKWQGRRLTAVDHLLGDKPTEFQIKLLNLGRECNWDENDPGFAVPLVLGQVEKVLEIYPEKIRQELDAISDRLMMRWEAIQAGLDVSAMKGTQAGERVDQHLANAKALFDLEIAQMKGLLLDERLALQKVADDGCREMLKELAVERLAMVQVLTDKCEAMVQLSQQLTEQQQQVLVTQTNELIAEGVVASCKRADKQVKQIVDSAKAAHFWQSFGFACCSALALVGLTLVIDGRADRLSDWGRFESWNQDQLQACRKDDLNTCNIHIKPPN